MALNHTVKGKVLIGFGVLFGFWASGALYLWSAVQDVNSRIPLRVTQWWRAPKQKLRGSSGDKSKHLVAWGIDLVPRDPTKYDAALEELNKWPGVYAIAHVGTAKHIHAQLGLYPLRNNPKKELSA